MDNDDMMPAIAFVLIGIIAVLLLVIAARG